VGAKCKTECTSEIPDVLYILLLLGIPAIANPGDDEDKMFL